MMSKNCLICFILLLFVFKCYAILAQSDLCKFDTSSVSINCDRSNPLLFVSESENGCRGSKCWCILFDNQNHYYNGDVVVELVHIFNRRNGNPGETQSDSVYSNLSYKVVPNLNRWFVIPYASPGGISKISSIKINNNEICRFTTSVQRYRFEEPMYRNIPLPPPYENNSSHYYADCSTRTGYTENAMRYCHNYRHEFVIEKRYMRNGEAYWCIIINNDKNTLTPANHLHIVYSSPYRHMFSPLAAHIGRGQPGSEFHLGSPQTIIAISEYGLQLANLISITIDNQPICNYFEPRVQQDLTSRSFIPDVPQNKNLNTDIVNYSTIEQPPVNHPSVVKPTSSPNTCGIKPIKKNSLIAFGTATNPGDWPWHAAIYKHKTKANREFICGGTLIDRKTIITAVHCVVENHHLVVIPDRLIVELGRHILGDIASVATQQLKVYDVVLHEMYNPDSFENDIAILVLATYVQFTQYVNVVCLPQPHEMFENRMGTTVGWGLDEHNQLKPDLKEVTLPVVDNIMCLESNREFFRDYLTSTNFCAGYRNETNVCRGDSGGGLVFKTNGHWVLGGITSLGVLSKTDEHHCDLKQYVIFTNVAEYLPWIKEHS